MRSTHFLRRYVYCLLKVFNITTVRLKVVFIHFLMFVNVRCPLVLRNLQYLVGLFCELMDGTTVWHMFMNGRISQRNVESCMRLCLWCCNFKVNLCAYDKMPLYYRTFQKCCTFYHTSSWMLLRPAVLQIESTSQS